MAQVLALAVVLPVRAQDAAEPARLGLSPPALEPTLEPAPPAPPDPVVAILRGKLADPDLLEGAHADDLAALQSFYATRTGGALWMTEMGFSARAQQALFEIEKADDWGLDPEAFALPQPSVLPASAEAQAAAEIKLDLAILKYARFARGGRLDPSAVSGLFDQTPPLRDPNTVLAEIEAAKAPGAYLQSLHPAHEQFKRLRQALLEARGKDAKSAGTETDIKRLIINMERWRWMPEDLGALYVFSNTPAFMLYVVKNGKAIYADKTQVGTIGNATPVFSDEMETIVFNPEWIAPTTVLVADLLPRLRKKNYAVLKKHGFSVSYQGNPVNPAKVDWAKVNIRDFTFTQRAGPHSNLGKVKFLLPNRHDVVLHDTFPARKKIFEEKSRAIGYACVRMEKPDRLAEVILAEDKGWQPSQVKDLWDNSVNSPVTLDHKIPVHTTYFTAVADETGKVVTFADLYGLDHKQAAAMFGDAKGFPMPPAETKRRRAGPSLAVDRSAGRSGVDASLQGFLGN